MAKMRALKKELALRLVADDWQDVLPELTAMNGQEAVGPLFALLPRGGELTHRAAVAIGAVVTSLAAENMGAGREVMRRLMWHMNEESGNFGWGIPETFAEILAACPALCKEFAGVLISYIMDTGREDNFCDNAVLRRSCFWGVGRLSQVHPETEARSRAWLLRGLFDEDTVCRGMAAWALSFLPPSIEDAPALRNLAEAGHTETCTVYENGCLNYYTVTQLAQRALGRKL